MLHLGSLAPPIGCSHGPPPTLCQQEEDYYEMSRLGNPLRECFCHKGSEVLSNILLKSSVALLVIKEKMWRIMPAFQENAGGCGCPGRSTIVTSSCRAYSSAGGWTTVTSDSRDTSTSDKPWTETFCMPTSGTYSPWSSGDYISPASSLLSSIAV